MQSYILNKDFTWIGAQDHELRVFDIIMHTEYGTSYNSYCLKTSEGLVLFETVKEKFFDEYINHINEIANVNDIKYIVVNHTEPDHSGSIDRLLQLNSNITVISSMIASKYLSEIINKPFNSRIIKDNEELSLGNYTLKFISVPSLHWPDTMYTYIPEITTLVTCDSFGAHYADDNIVLSKVTNYNNYLDAFDYYTKMIMEPFKPCIIKAMDKIKDLDISLIACGHGPVIDTNPYEFINKYREFATAKPNNHHKAVIPYVSCYGYTKMMAEIIKETLETRNIETHIYDLVETDNNQVIEDMISADILLYGCPTLLNDALPPIYNCMNAIICGYHGQKIASAFGSYGWSGEAVGNMITRLKQQRMKVVDDGLKISFKPNNDNIEQIKAYANNIADYLLK